MPSKTHHQTEHKKTEAHNLRAQKEQAPIPQEMQWRAPGRPFKKHTKQYYLTALLIMLLVEVILFLFSEYILMFVVLSLVFLTFALASVPPREFTYRITNQGVQVEDQFYLWKELYDFYIVDENGYKSIRISTEDFLPGELVLTLGDESEEEIKNALIMFLPFREYVRPTFMDKAAAWLSKNFPLENQ